MSLFVKQGPSGAIIVNKDIDHIGKCSDIVIDGHIYGACLRIQSHYHSDHTVDLFKSKLDHDILMSKATKDILSSEKNCQDINFRPGIIGWDYDSFYERDGYRIRLLNNGHVLGSSQVEISNTNYSIGYSGDFYDISNVIKANHLIIDGSIGGLFKARSFTREDSILALRKLICKITLESQVIIKAHSGLLEKIFFWTCDLLPSIPRIADQHFINSLTIHSKYGYGSNTNIIDKNDRNLGFPILRSNQPFIRFVRQHEEVFNIESHAVIYCSRFQDNQKDPYKKLSEKSYNVSLSDHADIIRTLEYVSKVNPEFISVDQVRMGNPILAANLCNYIANELNIVPIKLEILPDERF